MASTPPLGGAGTLARDPTWWALCAALWLLVGAIAAEVVYGAPAVSGPLLWPGRALVVLGAGWTLWAYRVLGASYAPTAEHPDPAQALVRSGPYRWFDHPQYAGNLLSVVGLLAALGLRWSWLCLLPFVAAQAWRVRREERFLSARFGSGWSARGLKREGQNAEEPSNEEDP